MASETPIASFADLIGSEIDNAVKPAAEAAIPTATAVTAPTPEVVKQSVAGNEFDPKIESLPDLFKRDNSPKETKVSSEEPVLPKDANPAVSAAFQKITSDLKSERERVKSFESKIAELETKQSKSVDSEEIAKYQRRIEDYESRLKAINLEASPEYNEQILAPKGRLVGELEVLAKANDLEADAFLKAAAIEDPVERRKKINSITKELSQSDAFDARKAIDNLLELKNKDSELRKDISTTMKVMEERRERSVKEIQERSQIETLKSYQETFRDFTENGPAYFRKSTDNEGWNKSLEQIYNTALSVENTELTPKQKAQLTMQAVSFPVMRQMFDTYVSKSNEEITNLRAQLQKYASASPTSGPASAGTGSNGAEPLDKSLGLVAALEAGLR